MCPSTKPIPQLAAYMLIVKDGGRRAGPCVDVDGGSVLLVVDAHCLLDIAAIGAWGDDVKNLELTTKTKSDLRK